jgi:hypothetical protein
MKAHLASAHNSGSTREAAERRSAMLAQRSAGAVAEG